MSKHIIFVLNGKVYQANKNWHWKTIECVMKRLGVTRLEIGFDDNDPEMIEYLNS